MQSYTFVLKYRSRKTYKVVNALSRRVTLLRTTTTKLTRLQLMNTDYEVDEDFTNAWKASKETWSVNITQYLYYFIQEGYIFEGHQLCIPRGSLQENLIRELPNEGLGGHFGIDKTKSLVEGKYYWSRMTMYVKKCI